MKKVLIFTYYWPPAGGVAVQRWLKFSKYLPEFGWEPIIVTPRNGSYQYYDESLVKEVPSLVKVHYTDTFEPFELYNLLKGNKGKSTELAVGIGEGKKSFLQRIAEYVRANYFIPDARKGWMKYALREAEEILANEKIDAIITTGPPHSTHLTGMKLKKRFGLPWLADFRDPWTTIMYNKYLPRTEATIRKEQKMEAEVLEKADKVVLISKGLANVFSVPVSKPSVIYNGFDEMDYSLEPKQAYGYFTIRHIGNLLATENTPGLWKALKKMLASNSDFEKYFRFEFVGRVDSSIRKEMTFYGLDKWVYVSDFVKHNEAIQLMRGANILFFSIPDVPNNEGYMTGKFFEYIPAQRPILGFGNINGDASDILHQINREPIIDYNDEQTTFSFIEKYFSLWMKENKPFSYSGNKFQMLSRKELTRSLSEVLNSITA